MFENPQEGNVVTAEAVSKTQTKFDIIIRFEDRSEISIDTEKVHALAWGKGTIDTRHGPPTYTGHPIHEKPTGTAVARATCDICQWVVDEVSPPAPTEKGHWEC